MVRCSSSIGGPSGEIRKGLSRTVALWFASVRWAADGHEAFLVEDCEVAPLPGGNKRNWFSPGAEECLSLDAVVSGFILQANTRQLNRTVRDPRSGAMVNQLRRLNELGLFEPP